MDMSEEKMGELFRNESGLEFNYVGEKVREYMLPNGEELDIENVIFLNVSATGGHRIAAYDKRKADFVCYYIKPDQGWYIIWESMKGTPHFSK